MEFPRKYLIKYKALDNFVFPIVLHVCYPRGSDDSTLFFDADCPDCDRILKTSDLAYSATLLASGYGGYLEGCPYCGAAKLLVHLKDISDEDTQRLRKDKYFSKLLSRGVFETINENKSDDPTIGENNISGQSENLDSQFSLSGFLMALFIFICGVAGASFLGFRFDSVILGTIGFFGGLVVGAILAAVGFILDCYFRKEDTQNKIGG